MGVRDVCGKALSGDCIRLLLWPVASWGSLLISCRFVSLVMSVALRRALSKWCDASKLAIKWPNDLLFDGGKNCRYIT